VNYPLFARVVPEPSTYVMAAMGSVEWIVRRGGSVTVRDMLRGPRRFRESGDPEADLAMLVQAGLGSWEFTASRDLGGRLLCSPSCAQP
jgi:hypothetical protein